MKKILILTTTLALGLGIATPTYSQGFLDKVAAKLDGSGGGKSKGNTQEKDLEKEVNNKTLEGQYIQRDSRNLSGVYYTNSVIRVGKDNRYNYAKKVLINLFEAGNTVEITISTRFHHEGRTDLEKLVYTTKPGTPDYFPITNSKKLGHYLLDGIKGDANSISLAFETNALDFSKAAGSEVTETSWTFRHPEVLELEPGIVVIANLDDAINANTPAKVKVLEEKGSFVLFYKKEKEEVANKMTNAQVWTKIKTFYDKYMEMYRKADDERSNLPKPVTAFKDQPSNTDLVAATKKRMQEMPYYNGRELVYVYPVTAWENKFEYVGVLGKTLTYRQMQIIAVFKKGDKCEYARMLIRQDNSYRGGTSVEAWGGNQVFCSGDQQLEDVSCNKAMAHKK